MDETPISMIAIRDPITAGRISMIMRQRGWASKIIGDDNDILGQYLNLKPRVTFLGLEVGSSTGEIVALRIKEVDSQARIVFVSSRSKSDLVRQASYSAGAVGALSTPVLASDIEEAWPKIMGVVPNAPGLAALEPRDPPISNILPLPPRAISVCLNSTHSTKPAIAPYPPTSTFEEAWQALDNIRAGSLGDIRLNRLLHDLLTLIHLGESSSVH